MAFFKFRKGGDEHATPAVAPNSVEALRKRAKHRLIGASVLVLLAVVGFPMLFDSQPRPIPVDVAIEIPDKNSVAPLPQKKVVIASPSAGLVVDEESPPPEPKAPEIKLPAVVAATVAPAPAAPVADKPAPSTKANTSANATVAATSTAAAAAPAGRFVVQIGAFADTIKAREARQKLEKAGFKTYTQVVETKDGRRIRVRVGPFETKADATKAADKIKKLDLPTGILEL